MNRKILIALGCASMLICGCEKKVDENINQPGQEEVQEVAKTEFRTTDGKVVFKKAETTQEIIDKFKNDISDNYSDDAKKDLIDTIKEYAYVNDIAYAITYRNEDDTYAKYSGYFGKSYGAQYAIVFLLNKKTGEIIEVNPNVDDSYNYNEAIGLTARFSGETNSVDFFKTAAGYFFVHHTMNPDVIYTTSLIEIGMVDDYKVIESDEEGIYVYTEYDNDIIPVKSSYAKFNANGEKIG